MIGIK